MSGVADSVKSHCWQYQPRADANGILFNYSKTKISKITDGTSNTFLVGEMTSARGKDGNGLEVWVGPSWVTRSVGHTLYGINGPNTVPGGLNDVLNYYGKSANRHQMYHELHGFSSWHPGGAHFLSADGSIAFISSDTDTRVLGARATRAGGETVSGDDVIGLPPPTPPTRG
jgi:hypothetical protein